MARKRRNPTEIVWVAGHGPDRSHDSLHSKIFDKRCCAKEHVAGKRFWRITRLEYAKAYENWTKRTDEIGGEDVDAAIERTRQEEQYRTGRRVSEAKALALWRSRVAARRGR